MPALRLVPQDSDRRPGGKVLLIDDDAVLLGLMAQAFADAGYMTRTAENGRKGLLALDSYRPDLVVTDIVMPEMEGIGAILQIKRRPRPPMIIAISGAGPGGRRDYLSWARHLGADEVLAKPFRTSQIVALANRLLNNHSNHLAG
ncbi:response regulator [Phenylobacterium sp.]|uniref:response regulator n=1 Tax=Phenylobacterium sp. TaxID=1871053 RepID=UPI001227B441|nr:response regulator [Phenylobacterium sp.]THD50730.1 MAG: response regulator [Phenylobacterium sp.]